MTTQFKKGDKVLVDGQPATIAAVNVPTKHYGPHRHIRVRYPDGETEYVNPVCLEIPPKEEVER